MKALTLTFSTAAAVIVLLFAAADAEAQSSPRGFVRIWHVEAVRTHLGAGGTARVKFGPYNSYARAQSMARALRSSGNGSTVFYSQVRIVMSHRVIRLKSDRPWDVRKLKPRRDIRLRR